MGTSYTERHSVEADQNRLKSNNNSNSDDNNNNENYWNKGMKEKKQLTNKRGWDDCKHARL